MQIYEREYKELIAKGEEVHGIGPHGNMGNVDPSQAAWKADQIGVKWFTTGWPYSSGISLFCNQEQYAIIRNFAKGKES